MKIRNLLLLTFAMTAASCGNDDNNGKKPADAGQDMAQVDLGSDAANNVVPDMANPVDTGVDMPVDMAVPVDMTAAADVGTDTDTALVDLGGPCTHNAFTPNTQLATWDPNLAFDAFFYRAFHDMPTDPEYGFFVFEIYPELGGTVGPQNFTFVGQNYDSCSTCLLAYWCGPAGCNQTFLVQSGSVSISAAGTTIGDGFQATFTDLVFNEVVIDQATFTSTPVPNGDTWCIGSMTSTATTMAP